MILAPIFGPTLGGLILDHLDWRWIFYVNVPVGIVAVAMGMRCCRTSRRASSAPSSTRRPRAAGLGVPLFVYGLAEIGQSGRLRGAAGLRPAGRRRRAGQRLRVPRAARRRAAAQRAPLPQRVLQRRRGDDLRASAPALFGAMIIMPLYFQLVRGEDAVTTGLLLIPQGLGAAIAMPLAGRFSRSRRRRRVALVGLAVTLVTTVPFIVLQRRHLLLADRRRDDRPRPRHRPDDDAGDDRGLLAPAPRATSPTPRRSSTCCSASAARSGPRCSRSCSSTA